MTCFNKERMKAKLLLLAGRDKLVHKSQYRTKDFDTGAKSRSTGRKSRRGANFGMEKLQLFLKFIFPAI